MLLAFKHLDVLHKTPHLWLLLKTRSDDRLSSASTVATFVCLPFVLHRVPAVCATVSPKYSCPPWNSECDHPWKQGLGGCGKLRISRSNPPGLRVGPKSRDWGCCKEMSGHRETLGRTPCENRQIGGVGLQSKESPRTAGGHHEPGERSGTHPPSEPPEARDPADILILDIWSSELWQKKLLFS